MEVCHNKLIFAIFLGLIYYIVIYNISIYSPFLYVIESSYQLVK